MKYNYNHLWKELLCITSNEDHNNHKILEHLEKHFENKVVPKGFLESIRRGLTPKKYYDNSPDLLEAMENKFENDYDAYKSKWVIPDILYRGLTSGQMTIKEANEYIEENNIDLTLPKIATMREGFIIEQKNILNKDSKEFKELPPKMMVAALQYLVFLETKRDINNDYIIGIDKIKALYDLNCIKKYWEVETWDNWLKRFEINSKECDGLNYNDKEAYYTMLMEVSNLVKSKIKNRLKFIIPKFRYKKFNQETRFYQRAKYPDIVRILT